MMRTLLVDDEPKNTRILRKLLEDYCPKVQIIGDAGDIKAAYTLIRELKPDLVFLDIEMPYGNAFDLLDQLMPIDFSIIFITAFDDYTLKAFKYSAIDYLLKPVDIEELKVAVNKASEKIQNRTINVQLENLLENLKHNQMALQKIAIPTSDGIVFLNVDAIIRCEANGSYTTIYSNDNQKMVTSKGIKDYEDMLPATIFCRIHNSHLINLNRIKKYHKGRGGYVVMEDGTSIEVASRRKEEFLSKFG
jgi:two-component system, LytTR family, response regulator